MARNFVQAGHTLDFVNPGPNAVAAGDVVVAGTLLGVALVDIAPQATGSVALEGVFECPKELGVAFAQGQALACEIDTGAFAAELSSGPRAEGLGAVAFAAASAEAQTVLVKFTGVPCVVSQ
ncbi:DUF2190 family protein [Variovorax sp. J22P168]|uniref:DUF2190 family protein n=1 Tax=Variovorax jilinensis TaxID=3053513 RepID=UPI002574C090|nr:DUF2190 family protein [Variovorax sp. J22P168]MDM0011983.1 DUF2190 family protein [Variovorax sp. J22P168]